MISKSESQIYQSKLEKWKSETVKENKKVKVWLVKVKMKSESLISKGGK